MYGEEQDGTLRESQRQYPKIQDQSRMRIAREPGGGCAKGCFRTFGPDRPSAFAGGPCALVVSGSVTQPDGARIRAGRVGQETKIDLLCIRAPRQGRALASAHIRSKPLASGWNSGHRACGIASFRLLFGILNEESLALVHCLPLQPAVLASSSASSDYLPSAGIHQILHRSRQRINALKMCPFISANAEALMAFRIFGYTDIRSSLHKNKPVFHAQAINVGQ